MSQSFVAICPKGLESLLVEEIKVLGGQSVKESYGSVTFEGELTTAYRATLWSRLANRILMPLNTGPVESSDDLYKVTSDIDWEMHFGVNQTFKIDFRGTTGAIRHEQFGARRVKDAIVDQFMAEQDKRPSVEFDDPDINIQASLHKNQVRISLDLSGPSLHRRGYRSVTGIAPIKENLAAALLIRAGWPKLMEQQANLIDPLCGSGTLLIEAVLMAADIAPGLFRQRFGFEYWRGHKPEVWQELLDEAVERQVKGIEKLQLNVTGFEADNRTVRSARENIDRAGLQEHIQVVNSAFQKTDSTADIFESDSNRGLIISNPPYGERMGQVHELIPVYQQLGVWLKQFSGYSAAIITSETELAKNISIHADKRYRFQNGTLDCNLYCFNLNDDNYIDPERGHKLPPEVEALKNRIEKNIRKITGWAQQLPTDAYRIYDHDIPEFAVAIDRYANNLHVQESAAPASIPEKTAKRHIQQILRILPDATGIPSENIFLKTRQIQKGTNQYNKVAKEKKRLKVQEQGLTFLVNLTDYIDTGLFLDHRKIRSRIRKLAKDKSFLNLFAYTGAVSVYAADGGASSTLTIDMSNTYLQWAEDNMLLNNFSVWNNKFLKANCLEWIKTADQKFDLIFLDPPSFSNSKSMDGNLDIQRDHKYLIEKTMELLADDGTLIFSTNRRGFKLDGLLEESYTSFYHGRKSLSRDFSRQRAPHQCWEFKKELA
ncbi:MAG: bifunctional 23S rRNA (guanine(2069)-N(7))-methyltransferase RlmK/23S rRNA (guanine(2445)-N(2))-methyltransferase RlmL [Gammaproteobacteria bacterium]|nr:MAG: bifunctional 23S rRNA (guanine(2069)-N(7))-methyltransferase RlmK/23S rRNA (guanine(2445)-N(2))-methyltransferase RlmL [Gammaproteobacteria bacterium]